MPLEIKSGKTHKALTNLLNTEEYNLNKGYIKSNYNISLINENNNKQIINLPIYLISFLKKVSSLIIKNNYDFI